jgi:hypothetical protein
VRFPENFHQPHAFTMFVGLDQRPRGMLRVEFNGGIGDGATPFEFVRQNVLDEIDPCVQLLLWIVWIAGNYSIPDLLALVGELLDICDD